MRTLGLRLLLMFACMGVLAVGAMADVPANLIVTRGGFEWVWASPCAPEQPTCGDPLTLTNGWSVPTNNEWLASFTDTLDVYNAFNVTNGYLCAASYFDSGYNHCDPGDMQAGYIWGAPQPISNGYGGDTNPASEGLVVRTGTPEPSSLLLLGSGVLGVLGIVRRKISL